MVFWATLSFEIKQRLNTTFGKVAQLGTAPDSKSGKWMLFTRGFKSRPFLITNKEAGTKGAQLLCLHSYYLQDAVVWTSTIWG